MLVWVAFACSISRSVFALETHPDEFVQTSVAELARVAQAYSEGGDGSQHDLVTGVRHFLAEYTDVRTAARLILSAYWMDATPEQRERFVAAYANHVTRLLVDLVPDIDFQSVEIDAFSADPEETPVLIRATFSTSDRKTVHFVLVIHEQGDRWRIFDVIAEGISYVKLYRNQFRSEIHRVGLEAAIRHLEDKAVFRGARID